MNLVKHISALSMTLIVFMSALMQFHSHHCTGNICNIYVFSETHINAGITTHGTHHHSCTAHSCSLHISPVIKITHSYSDVATTSTLYATLDQSFILESDHYNQVLDKRYIIVYHHSTDHEVIHSRGSPQHLFGEC